MSTLTHIGDGMNKQQTAQMKRVTRDAIKALGSLRQAGERLGISHETVRYWHRRGWVAAEIVLRLEAELDGLYTRYELRPDVYGRP